MHLGYFLSIRSKPQSHSGSAGNYPGIVMHFANSLAKLDIKLKIICTKVVRIEIKDELNEEANDTMVFGCSGFTRLVDLVYN